MTLKMYSFSHISADAPCYKMTKIKYVYIYTKKKVKYMFYTKKNDSAFYPYIKKKWKL